MHIPDTEKQEYMTSLIENRAELGEEEMRDVTKVGHVTTLSQRAVIGLVLLCPREKLSGFLTISKLLEYLCILEDG